jgi:hypothetical protein
MKRKIAVLAATAAGLALPATAQAKNFQQTGYIKGDRDAVVKLRVGLENGQPAKIAGFRALHVRATCGRDKVRITLRAVTTIHVRRDHTFKARLSDDNGGVLRIAGKVRDGGRKAKGHLSTNEFKSGSKKCHVPRQRWRTST